MNISIITVCRNSENTILGTLVSVANQTHNDIEHIIVDGASSDNTLTVIENSGCVISKVLSEPDQGIYDAMNKGFALATGDVVAFLNSDDCYIDNRVLSEVASVYSSKSEVDFVYGDIVMTNQEGLTVRHWKTGKISDTGLRGNQIPHPALFVKREVLKNISPVFDSNCRISADLKQQLILINQKGAQGAYISRPLVKMAMGGASTGNLKGYLIGWKESRKVYNDVFGRGGTLFTIAKVFSKLRGVRRLF